MSDKLLRSIVRIIGQDLVKQSKSNHHIGTQEFHIEKFERLPDKDAAFQFEITTWNEVSDEPRVTEVVSVADLIGVMARLISFNCFSAIIAEVNKNPPKGAKHEKD